MEEEKERNLKVVCLKLNTLKVERIATEPAFRWVKASKVQICGAGMAGSYLYMLLSRDFDIGIKDVRAEPDCRCAWGIAYKQAKKLYREIGMNTSCSNRSPNRPF